MKVWIRSACISSSGVILWIWHCGPLSTNWASFKCHSRPEYCCWPSPSFYENSYHLQMELTADLSTFGVCSWHTDWLCNAVMYGAKPLRNVSNTSSLCCDIKRVHYSPSKVYLKICPVSVHQKSTLIKISLFFHETVWRCYKSYWADTTEIKP